MRTLKLVDGLCKTMGRKHDVNPSAAAATFSLQISKNSILHLLDLNGIL